MSKRHLGILASSAALCVALGTSAASAQKFAGLAPSPPLGSTKTDLMLKIAAHDVVMLRLSP